MPEFFDSNRDMTLFVPLITKEQVIIEDKLEDTSTIMEVVQQQIENLNDLCNTIDFDLHEASIDDYVEDALTYVNDHYLTIHDLEQSIENNYQMRLLFAFIYDLITTDLIKHIIPQVTKLAGFELRDLILLDVDQLKEKIFIAIKNRVDHLNSLKDALTDESLDVNYEVLKFTWYYDLFDTELVKFQENLLTPLILKYEVEINSYISHI
jgi:hypothetical protein